MNDSTLLKHINELVEEEQRLREDTQRSEQNTPRIHHLQHELDQCWDLLRQRRAKRDAGQSADEAKLRDVQTVEGYLN